MISSMLATLVNEERKKKKRNDSRIIIIIIMRHIEIDENIHLWIHEGGGKKRNRSLTGHSIERERKFDLDFPGRESTTTR